MSGTAHFFDLGDVPLQSGRVFPSMRLAYRTYGSLNEDKSNVILYPTSFAAQDHEIDWLVGDGEGLDTSRWFVVIPNLFGNGLSSSPSNAGLPLHDYPLVTCHDAVDAQHALLRQLGISRLAMVYGWSMGAMQAYHWASRYPDMVERIMVVCGAARCSPYNQMFLEGVRAALTADAAFQDGHFATTPIRGIKAMGRVYAGWVTSHAFFRDALWREAGFDSLESYLQGAWDTYYSRRDANDLLAQLSTWHAGNIADTPRDQGNLAAAMAAITAHVLLLPGETDRYFQVSDNQAELPLLINARSAALRVIPSPHGHRAGNPQRIPDDRAWLTSTIREFLGGVR
ncbi:hypothetical protein WM40_23055 [Robbsia andropogonis]|uniref:AB hydrolase-1 domain-containing protein n=1 Tax=Robbsia andropogonis TaxID=28092 RepID=A0A0F5JUU0_9BURK|nr:alpha/beta fold hydrolase [Robbsia andropogonis]KKB61440.1 hypothetical protein WM40_23055 [Robbsia andropogonis]MCP1121067.1 alpha/beta fold hydrolase [Robbsia andropogonis]MCP1130860.1 alpha/beta fold hydrolase [Robbsia andropogonis]